MLTLCLLEQHSSPEWYPDRKGWRKGWSVAFISSERLGGSLFSKRVQYVMGGGGQQPRRRATQSWTVGANVLFISPIFSSACTSAIKKALSKNVCEHICVTTRLVATEVYDAILYSHQSLWLFYTFFHIPSPFPPLVLSDQGGQGWKKKPADFVLFFIVLFFLWPASELGCAAGDFLSLKFYNFSRCFGSHRILIQLQLRANSAKFSTVYQ